MHRQRPTTAKPQINQMEIKALREQDQLLYQEIGSGLANFSILTELGKGSYGTVYKVKSNLNQQIYVLKKIDLTHLKPKQQSYLFIYQQSQDEALKEAQLLRKLNHPNIIRYFISFIEADSLCIIMEYAENGDLQQVIRKHRDHRKYIQEETIWQIARELASAIQHIHENNIIHRDIKSQNIFLAKNGSIKLGDLGVSKIFNSQVALKGTRVGTPLYLSPELIQQLPYDFKVDTWAFGCVIYNLVMLEPPFTGENLISLGMNIVNSAPKEFPSRYTNRLSSLVFKALEKIPVLRPNINEIIKLFFYDGEQKFLENPPEPKITKQKSNKDLRPFSSNPTVKPDQIHVNEKFFKIENLIVEKTSDQIPPIPKKKRGKQESVVVPQLNDIQEQSKNKQETRTAIETKILPPAQPPSQQPIVQQPTAVQQSVPQNLMNSQHPTPISFKEQQQKNESPRHVDQNKDPKLLFITPIRPYSAQQKKQINNYFHQQPLPKNLVNNNKKENVINIQNFLSQQKPHESIDLQQHIQKSTRIRNKFTIFDLKKFQLNDSQRESKYESKGEEPKGEEIKSVENYVSNQKIQGESENVPDLEGNQPQVRQKDLRVKSALNFFNQEQVKIQTRPVTLPMKKNVNTSEQNGRIIKKYTLKDIQDFQDF